MPQRPRQHVTEERSRRAFRDVLPPEWVFRDANPDYGIDGEVEIFVDGRTTGLFFKVQLKGTNEEELVVRLRHEMIDYYTSMDQPVLIVLYHEPDSSLFARWIQSYDPDEDPPSDTTVPIRFHPGDELTSANVGRLRIEVEVHRRLRDRRSAEPLRLAIIRGSDLVAGVPTAAVARSLQDIAREMPSIVRFAAEQSDNELGTITLVDDRISVNCHGLATSTVHYPVPWPGEPNLDQVVGDAMVTIGWLVHRIGAVENAAQLFATFALDSAAARNEGIVGGIANAFVMTRRIGDAIALIEALPEEAAQAMLFSMSLTWTARIDTMAAEDQQQVVDFLTRRAAREEEQSGPIAAATAHYTLANRLRALHQHSDAVAHYTRAAELDPTYLERRYYLGELGGALFESGNFGEAVRVYEEAVEQSDDESLRPRLADSLLHAGKYSAAAQAFAAMTEPSMSNPGWRLKMRLLEEVERLGIADQDRDIEAALRLADVSDNQLSNEERRSRLLESLTLDALCPLAWFNLGFLESSLDHLVEAEVAFANAAVIARTDLEAFARAIVLGLATGSAYTRDVVRIGYFFNHSDLIHALSHGIVAPIEVQTELMDFVEGALEDDELTSQQRESLTMRFVSDDGSFEEMVIGLD